MSIHRSILCDNDSPSNDHLAFKTALEETHQSKFDCVHDSNNLFPESSDGLTKIWNFHYFFCHIEANS